MIEGKTNQNQTKQEARGNERIRREDHTHNADNDHHRDRCGKGCALGADHRLPIMEKAAIPTITG